MNIEDLDQRFLKVGHDLPIGTAWNLVKSTPRKIVYIIVEIASGAYILIKLKELRDAIQKLPKQQVMTLTLDVMLKDHPVQKAFDVSQYGRGEAEFLLELSPRT